MPVALARQENRYHSVSAALACLDCHVCLDGVRRLLIKPNFVSTTYQLASTHVDAIRAVLDFVRTRYGGAIVIAEGAALSPTREGFRNFGYRPLAEAYDAQLLDLNADDVVSVPVYDRRLRPMTVHVAHTVVEADYRISVGPPKTHDCVVVTLTIKNMVMGSLVNPRAVQQGGGTPGLARRVGHLMPERVRRSPLAEWAKGALLSGPRGSSKMAMHQGYPAMNLNLALVAPHVWPHLAVIDGWRAMEGSGPNHGDAVDWRLALASTDALAADTLTAHLMGFDPAQIGYLAHCRRMGLGQGDVECIDVLGNLPPAEGRRRFKPHPGYRSQLAWRLPHVEQYLPFGNRTV